MWKYKLFKKKKKKQHFAFWRLLSTGWGGGVFEVAPGGFKIPVQSRMLASQLILVQGWSRSHPGRLFLLPFYLFIYVPCCFWISLFGTFVDCPGGNRSMNSCPRFGLWHLAEGADGVWVLLWAGAGAVRPPWTCSCRFWRESWHGLCLWEDALSGAGRRSACSEYFKKLLFLCWTRQVVELPWEYISDDVCPVENKAQAQDRKQWQVRWFCVSVASSGEHVWILSC